MSEETENTEVETQETPEEGKKKRRGRPPGSGKKSKEKKSDNKNTDGLFYVIGAGENITDCDPKIVKAETLMHDIASFAEQADIKIEEVIVFELGPRVKVEQELKITPVNGG